MVDDLLDSDPAPLSLASEMLGGTRQCDSAESALDGADAVVLVTEWPEFRELDWAGDIRERMRNPLVVDGRNFLDDEALREKMAVASRERAVSEFSYDVLADRLGRSLGALP